MTVDNNFLGDFSLERKRVGFTVKGVPYYIQEMTAQERDRYLNKATNRAKRMKGRTKFDFDGVHAELMAMCVFKTEGDVPMKIEEFIDWPASLSQAVFEKAQEINALTIDTDEAAGATAKND